MSKTRRVPAKTQKPAKKRARAGRLPRRDQSRKIIERLQWRDVTLSVSYEPKWLDPEGRFPLTATAHLEVKVIAPRGALLPVTDTGYRSHFLAPGVAERAGRALAYTTAWLDEAAKSPTWQRKDFASRQLSLF